MQKGPMVWFSTAVLIRFKLECDSIGYSSGERAMVTIAIHAILEIQVAPVIKVIQVVNLVMKG